MRTRADSPTKTCTETGCGNALRARGLCSTHYNQQHQPDRHPKTTVLCTQCETPCVKEVGRDRRYGGLFCSMACRDAWRQATGNNPAPSPEARAAGQATRASRRWKARAKLRVAARGRRGCRWVGGRCERCGSLFVAPVRGFDWARYCSDRCKLRSVRSRRRARLRSAETERYSRHAIFERDGWRCHICRRMTRKTEVVPHSLAPTIDHLIPLARGGGDTPANVATAHFICNSIKSDGAGRRGDQLAIM